MQQIKIQFKDAKDVSRFVNEVSKLECDVDLSSGRYLIDAKSLVGILALGIDKTLDLIIHSNDEELKYRFNEWKVI